MKKGIFYTLLLAFAAFFLTFAAPVMASPITLIDFTIPTNSGGTIVYDTNVGAITGSGINIGPIDAYDNPLPLPGDAVPVSTIQPAGYTLSFTLTGGSTTDNVTTFDNGTITITNGSDPFLTGTFNWGATFEITGTTFIITAGGFTDTKYPALFTALNVDDMSNLTWAGGLNISGTVTETSAGSGVFTGTSLSGDVTNSPVPIPPSVLLLGSGFIGLLGFGLRRKRNKGIVSM